jgi:hypothetical protein
VITTSSSADGRPSGRRSGLQQPVHDVPGLGHSRVLTDQDVAATGRALLHAAFLQVEGVGVLAQDGGEALPQLLGGGIVDLDHSRWSMTS